MRTLDEESANAIPPNSTTTLRQSDCLPFDGQSLHGLCVNRYAKTWPTQCLRAAAVAEGHVFPRQPLNENVPVVGTFQVLDVRHRTGPMPASRGQDARLAGMAAELIAQ